MHGNEYQFQSLHTRLIPQVLSEVEAIHILVDETERVCFSRVHPYERYYIHIFVVKEATYESFVMKPLREMSAAYSAQALAVVATYRNHPSDIERYVGTIRL